MPVGHGGDGVGIGGGGIKRVAELPTPKRGSVVYVKAPYNLVTRERFNLVLTPGALPRSNQVGYVGGDLAIGSLEPHDGDIVSLLMDTTNGEITMGLTSEAFEAFGSLGNLLVSFDGSSFQMNIDDPDGVELEGVVNYLYTSAGAVPAGDRWAAGTPVAVAVTNRGEGIGVTGSGIKKLGDSDTSGDRFDFPEGFYHVDPVNGEWTEGFGSADGGLPAVLLPEAGVSDADTRNHKWRGLLVGLAREDAGSDWRLRTAAGQEAVQPRVRWTDGTATLVATLEASRAVGAAGNAWGISASFAGAGNPTSAGANSGAMVILLRLGPGATYAQAAAALNTVAGISAVVTGDGSRVLATSFARFAFAGGLDAADMGVEMDVAAKIITLEHLTGHTQAEALAFLHERQIDEDTTLHAVAVGGTDTSRALAAAPLERPFVETYLHGSLPRHSAGDLAAVAAVAQANAGFLATFAARVRAVVEMIVPAWARAAEPPEELPEHDQQETRGLFSRAGALFWSVVNQVPNAPGSAASIGRVLTVTGENDRDYAWRSITDTVRAIVEALVPAWARQPEPSGGGGGPAFVPTKANLYAAVKAIFSHNPSVTPDDADNELDFSPGAAGAIADDSILPIKARASTTAFKKDWRERFASSSIGLVANALPAIASHNTGDTLIIGRGGATVVPFREVDEPATELTDTVAGDVMMVLAAGWTRIGNLFSGGIAAAAAKAIADANKTKVDRLTVFSTARLIPGGIPNNTLPEFIALELAGKVDPRRIIEVKVAFPSGITAYTLNSGDLLAALNEPRVVDNKSVGPGGILNISFDAAARNNFQTDFGNAAQFLRVDIHYKFEGTSLAGNVPPDARDYIHFGTNNNAFPLVTAPPALFERAVGASASAGNVPAGTYELVGYCTKPNAPDDNRTRRYPFNIALADIPAASVNINVATRNPNGSDDDNQDISLALAYVPATRTLTYSIVPAGAGSNANGRRPVLGSIRARGFA